MLSTYERAEILYAENTWYVKGDQRNYLSMIKLLACRVKVMSSRVTSPWRDKAVLENLCLPTSRSFTFHSCSDGKEMYKNAWCTCKVVVLLIKPTSTFLPSSLLSPCVLFDGRCIFPFALCKVYQINFCKAFFLL